MMDLITALGLLLVVEGILFAALPGVTRRAMRLVVRTPVEQLRLAGIVSALIGILVIYVVKFWLY